MHSCIYQGEVTHRRDRPIEHEFRYTLFMLYLDLDELPDLIHARRLISTRRVAPASFLVADHQPGLEISLQEAARNRVAQQTGIRPVGPIRLLTQLRYFGYYFSPLNLYYCFSESGQNLDAVVAEVSNTPWGERHHYVLWSGNRISADADYAFSHEKAFHVSPFMDMDLQYYWKLSVPAEEVSVQLTNSQNEATFFQANLNLQRQPLSRSNLNRNLLCYPLMTVQIMAAIYYQAFRLWIKKCPNYPHPNSQTPHPKLPA